LNGRYSYRSVLTRNGITKVCNSCKTKDERILAVHHIDKDKFNNSLENLVWLCHNCHFLVHHYEDKK
jgi:predicted HNH restriction endonuclease